MNVKTQPLKTKMARYRPAKHIAAPTCAATSVDSRRFIKNQINNCNSFHRISCFCKLMLLFFCLLFPLVNCFVVPEEPRRVRLRAINSTAIHISWRPPRDPNNVIRGYQIHYQVRDESKSGRNWGSAHTEKSK
jgi:hypothetical protein